MTTPAALIPAFSPSSSTDSRVTIATTREGSVTSISTLRQEAVELDRADDPAEAVARRERLVTDPAAEPLDLGGGDDAAVGGVALDPDLAVAIPAPQRVDADPERSGGLGGGECLPRHCLDTIAEARTPQR